MGIDAALLWTGSSSVGRGLHELAEVQRAVLLVVGSNTRSLFGRVMVGDHTRNALNGAPCAVAVAPAGYAGRPVVLSEINIGYDGSEASRAAVTVAARRAGAGGKVFVVHAYHLPPDFLGSPNFDRQLSAHRDHGRALLDTLLLVGNDELLDVEYETELLGGPPAQAIADVARARDADEIVVGAHGHGRVRALLGGVSHELLHIADRPVVVIPAAAAAQRESQTHRESAAPG